MEMYVATIALICWPCGIETKKTINTILHLVYRLVLAFMLTVNAAMKPIK